MQRDLNSLLEGYKTKMYILSHCATVPVLEMRRMFDFMYLSLLQTHRCKSCNGYKKNPKIVSADNDMDPGDVPPQLEGRTQVEQMFIAKVAPIMHVYRLKGGQYTHGGHVVNIPQDVTGFTTGLPHLAADIAVLVVRRQGAEAESHKDFVNT